MITGFYMRRDIMTKEGEGKIISEANSTQATLQKLNAAILAASVEQIFHPGETAIRRVQNYHQKIDTTQKFKEVIFNKVKQDTLNQVTKSEFSTDYQKKFAGSHL